MKTQILLKKSDVKSKQPDSLSKGELAINYNVETPTLWYQDSNDAIKGVDLNHQNRTDNPHNVTKAQVGLGNVDNTSDVNKPISNAVKTALEGKSDTGHTHNYAGSSSVGGSANSAAKLDTSAGSATEPIYFSEGKPTKCTYTLGASVPSDAKFTDTTYAAGDNINISNGKISATGIPTKTSQLTNDSGFVTSTYSLPIASSSTLGGIKVGSNLSINSDTGVLNATDTTYTAGDNISIDSNNKISVTGISIPTSAYSYCVLQEISADTTISAPGLQPQQEQTYIFLNKKSTAVTVTMPNGYTPVDGNTSISIASNKYGEVNCIVTNAGAKYCRSVGS